MLKKKENKKELIMQAALELFASKGFYTTTIPDIAASLKMSVGNMYNYFKSKDILAKEIIKYISSYLGNKLREINEQEISTKEKTRKIVEIYFKTASLKPEMIDYFLRIYLSNREVFKDSCEGMICVNEFVTEIMIYFEEGVKCGDLREQDFFSAFGLFMGYLGGMVFLKGENILPKDLNDYIDDIAFNIYKALSAE
ncbi:MAG: TetR family transcriptional regulator [Sulfurimonas sp. RIFOXYD12_FULL_33_39]|uniref:TetR/AcrR family transcriptional regulator n=1 Tax=unclassified Sulfurimonas TaxID=2623549 RepID=UPI0008AF0A64|nr:MULTISPECIES: TetR/AcrR family transcriptional regulator [unclassified Sulfurimonas]OHE06005.1 MAG: TetR family transcriptional regulator [Sulfurimonas sp. RIFCSPLOWO2_12_FULL_34_6]OHE10166.1 MAG: TetR family transcriptional regulator [Sulfurimonas sp. RIFOXYD12_FULL_33_39]OHE14613.1 MAG: TetR family transcriptional regulator [Sulfurimonas sp. RIFOXYD2_FULL_34_21]DAB28155.1 MAG TPA: TetR family transcriptional regulator [Sulfurimonas sp. UBA10385]